ncbi:MAG: hypothetical protein IMZ59_05090 [Actinobacteria bacterium]|nr:hypothetical protein [Actinomycetota bacterium]
MVSHATVIKNYFNAYDRKHYNKGSNVFFEGNTLYSYGHHFILCQKVKNGYIINGDKYSNSTAKHQSYTIGNSPEGTPQIPFSAINQILKTTYDFVKQLQQIEIIDKTDDTYTEKTRIDEKTGETITYQEHHLGASLIRYKNKYFLSSIDPGSKNYSYFLVELKHSVNSVKEAFRSLADKLNDTEYQQYEQGQIKRQGEYFLIPTEIKTSDMQLKQIQQQGFINRSINTIHPMTEELRQKLKTIETEYDTQKDTLEDWDKRHHLHNRIQIIKYQNKEYIIEFNGEIQQLPKNYRIKTVKGELKIFNYSDKIIKSYDLSEGIGNSHTATETIKDKQGNTFIRGTLRHLQHKMISLGKIWHRVVKNTAKRSFTATGRVD